MKFTMSQCQLCGECVFDEVELQAFQVRDKMIELFSLNGRQPWCGVRCVCLNCVEQLQIGAPTAGNGKIIAGTSRKWRGNDFSG